MPVGTHGIGDNGGRTAPPGAPLWILLAPLTPETGAWASLGEIFFCPGAAAGNLASFEASLYGGHKPGWRRPRCSSVIYPRFGGHSSAPASADKLSRCRSRFRILRDRGCATARQDRQPAPVLDNPLSSRLCPRQIRNLAEQLFLNMERAATLERPSEGPKWVST
jgi:hypothetical protein